MSPTTRAVLPGPRAVASSRPLRQGPWLPLWTGRAGAEEEPTAEAPGTDAPAAMPQRVFGKTGRKVSLFGLGCYPLGGLANDRVAVDVVTAALEAGCTYLDTAPLLQERAQ